MVFRESLARGVLAERLHHAEARRVVWRRVGEQHWTVFGDVHRARYGQKAPVDDTYRNRPVEPFSAATACRVHGTLLAVDGRGPERRARGVDR